MGNFMSGIGASRDNELAKGCRQNPRNFNSGIERERDIFQLGISTKIRHGDLVEGDLVSLQDGVVVPLNPSLEFVGLVEKIGEDRGRYQVGVISRCAILARVEGLSPDTRESEPVYARPGPRTVFTLDEQGGVLIGAVCALENIDRKQAIVGIRRPGDARKFELGGPRRR